MIINSSFYQSWMHYNTQSEEDLKKINDNVMNEKWAE